MTQTDTLALQPANLSIDNWMVGWNPNHADVDRPGAVMVGRWPDKTRWSDAYKFTTGNCWLDWRKWPLDRKVKMMFIEFHHMLVRDGVDPQAAHREFLKIGEYRRCLAADIEGSSADQDEI